MSQITVGKPDLRTADKRAVALGNFLRHSKTVKSREGILNGERHDFFRLKRAVRAMLEPAYEKYRKSNPILPELKTDAEAFQLLQQFPLNRIAFNVQKLESEIALARGLKPVSGIPCLVIAPQQKIDPEEYYAWFYNPVPLSSVLYTVGAVALVLAMIAFPLWPYKLRKMGWYMSMSVLGFLIFLLGLAVVRLVLFVFTYFTVKPGIWLFPNLFEDLGFFESFVPLYCWHGQNALPQKHKKKKRVKTEEQRAATKAEADKIRAAMSGQQQQQLPNPPTPSPQQQQTPQGGPPIPGLPPNAPPQVQELMKRAMQQTLMRTEARKQAIIKERGGSITEADHKALHEKIFEEEAKRTQGELEAFSRNAQAQAQAQAQAKAQAQAQATQNTEN